MSCFPKHRSAKITGWIWKAPKISRSECSKSFESSTSRKASNKNLKLSGMGELAQVASRPFFLSMFFQLTQTSVGYCQDLQGLLWRSWSLTLQADRLQGQGMRETLLASQSCLLHSRSIQIYWESAVPFCRLCMLSVCFLSQVRIGRGPAGGRLQTLSCDSLESTTVAEVFLCSMCFADSLLMLCRAACPAQGWCLPLLLQKTTRQLPPGYSGRFSWVFEYRVPPSWAACLVQVWFLAVWDFEGRKIFYYRARLVPNSESDTKHLWSIALSEFADLNELCGNANSWTLIFRHVPLTNLQG